MCEKRHQTEKALNFACDICLGTKGTGKDDKTIKAVDVSPYAHHILWLRTLQLGRYPFNQNDLSLEEWEDLGQANETIESIKSSQMAMAGMPRKMGM
jgi:hypothetical protein